jgi:hypothetical protein
LYSQNTKHMIQEEKVLLATLVSILLFAVVFKVASKIVNRGRERFMDKELTKEAMSITLILVGVMTVLALSSRVLLELVGVL